MDTQRRDRRHLPLVYEEEGEEIMKRLFSQRWLCEKFTQIAIDTHCTLAEMLATEYEIDVEACPNRIEEEKARGWIVAQANFEKRADNISAEYMAAWQARIRTEGSG